MTPTRRCVTALAVVTAEGLGAHPTCGDVSAMGAVRRHAPPVGGTCRAKGPPDTPDPVSRRAAGVAQVLDAGRPFTQGGPVTPIDTTRDVGATASGGGAVATHPAGRSRRRDRPAEPHPNHCHVGGDSLISADVPLLLHLAISALAACALPREETHKSFLRGITTGAIKG